MSRHSRIRLAAAFVALGFPVMAQQPAATPPPPAFAPPNLTPAGVRAMAANCAACHGTNGRALPGSPVAGLAGRPSAEIAGALAEFRDGKRPATLMHQIAKGYGEAETAAIAEYFSRQPREARR